MLGISDRVKTAARAIIEQEKDRQGRLSKEDTMARMHADPTLSDLTDEEIETIIDDLDIDESRVEY